MAALFYRTHGSKLAFKRKIFHLDPRECLPKCLRPDFKMPCGTCTTNAYYYEGTKEIDAVSHPVIIITQLPYPYLEALKTLNSP